MLAAINTMQRARVIADNSGESTKALGSLEISSRDQAPHEQGKAESAEEVSQGGDGIQPVAKGANLGSCRYTKRGRDRAESPFREAGDRSAGSTHADGKNGQNNGHYQTPPNAACCRAS